MPLRNLIIVLAFFNAVNAFPVDKASIPTKSTLREKNSYSTLPLFSIFQPIIELFPNLADIGPKIEIGNKYTNIIIKADHYKVEELTVEVKGRHVSIEGSRTTVHDNKDMSSEFLYTASLPKNANTSDVFAKFYSDNYLVVTTPNKGLDTQIMLVDRLVPIIASDDTYIKTEKHEDKTDLTEIKNEEVRDIVDRIVPIIVSDDKNIKVEKQDSKIEVTTIKSEALTQNVENIEPITVSDIKNITSETQDKNNEVTGVQNEETTQNIKRIVPIIVFDNKNTIQKDQSDETITKNEEVTENDKIIVPIIMSDDRNDKIENQVTDEKNVDVTENVVKVSSTPDAVTDSMTTVSKITTEEQLITAFDRKEETTESSQASSDDYIATSTSSITEEKEAEIESEVNTPSIEVIQNTTPYFENEISDLEPIISSI